MSHSPSPCYRWERAHRLLWLSIGVLAFAITAPVAVLAEDDRPTDIPYDTPGEIPQLSPNAPAVSILPRAAAIDSIHSPRSSPALACGITGASASRSSAFFAIT